MAGTDAAADPVVEALDYPERELPAVRFLGCCECVPVSSPVPALRAHSATHKDRDSLACGSFCFCCNRRCEEVYGVQRPIYLCE